MLPGMPGMELLERIVARDPGVDVVMITGAYTPDSAVQAIRLGAADYLPKPVSVEKLRTTIRKLAENARERQSIYSYEQGLLSAFGLPGHGGPQPYDARGFRHSAARRPPLPERVDHGRNRNRQGTGCARPAPAQPGGEWAIHRV